MFVRSCIGVCSDAVVAVSTCYLCLYLHCSFLYTLYVCICVLCSTYVLRVCATVDSCHFGAAVFLLVYLSVDYSHLLKICMCYLSLSVSLSGADLTGGHSCSGRRGPWEAGPWRPPGLAGPGKLNFGLQLQNPDCNLN